MQSWKYFIDNRHIVYIYVPLRTVYSRNQWTVFVVEFLRFNSFELKLRLVDDL